MYDAHGHTQQTKKLLNQTLFVPFGSRIFGIKRYLYRSIPAFLEDTQGRCAGLSMRAALVVGNLKNIVVVRPFWEKTDGNEQTVWRQRPQGRGSQKVPAKNQGHG
jgi:hypothetical protein